METKIQTAERCSQNEASDNVIFQRHLFAYEQAAERVSGKVAEVGCGEGYGIPVLLPHVDLYMGMDKYPTPVTGEQREKVIFKSLQFPDFSGVPVRFFDFVICFQVIEHIKDDCLFVSKIAQLLKPGGTLLLTTPHAPMSLTRNPFHVREYEYPALHALLSPHFSRVDIRGVYGKQQAREYYEANKQAVARVRKWDVFDFEHKMPAALLKIPYNLLNRRNRRKLLRQCNTQTARITTDEFYLDTFHNDAYDFFAIAEKA
ncbi:MAG: class I SAM-dependent methyltransferase [Prevotellaceae bacterium]|jgi:SAM-dependent methyltransferase|nr:class I SAM-dependent methyltransferase [Prevotellaceae bacterium]